MRVDFAKRALAQPALPVFLVALALLLSAPAWWFPFLSDDLVHAAKLTEGHPIKERGYFAGTHHFGSATMLLFDWFRPEQTLKAMDYGVMPWWASEDAQESFWRPISAATHWLDYRLWPASPMSMHIHNSGWFVLFILAAWLLYRDLDRRSWVAGLATLLLVLNQENWQALSWIAARNSLITAFLVALTLWLHHHHVSKPSWKWGVAAWGSFATGLLAGEGAVTAAAYVFAYALFLDDRSRMSRALGLLPYGVIVVVWRVVYRTLGFGVACSGLYVDPTGEPVEYVLNLLEWGPLMLLSVATSPILNKYAFLAPGFSPWAWGLAVVGVLVGAAVLAPVVLKERAARAWCLGLLLTVVPACAARVPADRVTLYAMLGFAPLAATFVAGVIEKASWLPSKRYRRLLISTAGILLLALHVLQPLPGHVKRFTYLWRRSGAPVPVAQILQAGRHEVLICVSTPDTMFLSYVPFLLVRDGLDIPDRMRTLSSSLGDTLIRRTGTHELTLASVSGPLVPTRARVPELPPGSPAYDGLYKVRAICTAFRAEHLGFSPGETVALPDMTVTVRRVDERDLPVEVVVKFDRALEDARYRWVTWDSRADKFMPFVPPPVGEEVVIPGAFHAL